MSYLIHWFDSIDSTNTRLLADRDSLPDRTVYAARFQTAGRGQMGNRWQSRPGENLTFSILLKPAGLAASDQFILTQAVALGLVDYLQQKGLEASIKWPNDIYVNDSKVCGTLIETSLSGGLVSSAVAGMGLNMNQTDFDPSLPNPTSMALLTGQRFEITKELPVLLDCLFRYLDQLENPHACNGFDADYLARLYRRGEWHTFEALPASEIPTERRSGVRFEARILGIDRDARLLLERRDGTLASFGFKELKYVI